MCRLSKKDTIMCRFYLNDTFLKAEFKRIHKYSIKQNYRINNMIDILFTNSCGVFMRATNKFS